MPALSRRSRAIALALAWTFALASSSFAQGLRDPSSLPFDRDRLPIPDYQEDAAPPLSLDLPPLDALSETTPFDAGPGIIVRGFRIVGSSVFSDEELALAVAPFLDRVLHAGRLPAVTDALTRLYIDEGYVSSGAIVPDQTIENGVVEIHIIEGRVGRLEIVEGGRLHRRFVEPRLRRGLSVPLDIDALEESLRLLQMDDRVARVDAVLRPSPVRGESVVRLEIEEATPWRTDLRVTNDLAPSLGGSRAIAEILHRNALGLGDTVSGSVSGARGLFDLELAYSVPFTRWLTEFEMRGSVTRGEVVEGDFADDGIRNDLESFGVALIQPLWRTVHDDVRFVFELERRRSRLTFIEGAPLQLELGPEEGERIRLSLLRLYLDWVHREPDQVFAVQLRSTIGLDAWNATTPNHSPPPVPGRFADPTLPDAEFTSWLVQMQYARRIDTPLGVGELITRGDLQIASGSLFSLESFAMGGASTVRGYHENAVVADNGTTGSIELRLPLLPVDARPHELRVAPFFDTGFVWDDHEPNARDFDRLFASLGLGLLYRYGGRFELNAYWGQALNKESTGDGDSLQDWGFHVEASVFVF